MKFRIEEDSLGKVRVPRNALWGAQTQRAIDNFPISGISMNFPFTCLANQPDKAPAARLPPESSPMDFPMLYRQASSAERIQQNSKSLLDPFLFA